MTWKNVNVRVVGGLILVIQIMELPILDVSLKVKLLKAQRYLRALSSINDHGCSFTTMSSSDKRNKLDISLSIIIFIHYFSYFSFFKYLV